MTSFELPSLIWLLAGLSVFWGVFFWAICRTWVLRWYFRVLAVFAFLMLGGIAGELKAAPKLGVVGLVDLVLWPVVTLNALIGAGPISSQVRLNSGESTAPAGVWAAEIALGLASAFQSYMIWRFLLKKAEPKPLVGEDAAPVEVIALDSSQQL
jgi:hypothetical protein